MATKTNLLNRNGRWHFNKAFPKRLWPVTGSAPFRRSLNTDSLEVAQQRRPHLDQEYWAIVKKAERRLLEPKVGHTERAKHLSENDVFELFVHWYHDTLLSVTEEWPDKMNTHELAVQEEALRDQIAEAREEVASGDFWYRKAIARRLLEEAGFETSDREALVNLQKFLARGSIELDRQQLSWLRGDYTYSPADPIVARAAAAGPSQASTEKTVGDLIDAYRAAEEHKWSPSTQSSYKPIWRLLEDVLGRGKLLGTIDRTVGRDLFDLVQKLPKNIGKKRELASLPIPEAIMKGAQLGLPTISPKTINGTYMGFLSTIFTWAVREQWMDTNPVTRLSVTDKVAAADKRDPFSIPQLNQLFALEPWKPKNFNTNPLLYWGPLIALFQGMRRGEIAQLAVGDIRRIEGVLVIRITDEGEGQRVKTAAARRILPVHRELLALGFVDYLDDRQAAGEVRFFSGEAPNSRGQWGSNLTRWFSGKIKSEGFEGKRLGMHSFRHSFEDSLRAAELHGTDIGRELTGRSNGMDTSSSYGSGYSVKQLKNAINKVEYPGLKLPHNS